MNDFQLYRLVVWATIVLGVTINTILLLRLMEPIYDFIAWLKNKLYWNHYVIDAQQLVNGLKKFMGFVLAFALGFLICLGLKTHEYNKLLMTYMERPKECPYCDYEFHYLFNLDQEELELMFRE